jgi:hypothetical protein
MSESADESRLELPISLSASRIYLSDIRAHFRLLIIHPLTQLPGLEETEERYKFYAGGVFLGGRPGQGGLQV